MARELISIVGIPGAIMKAMSLTQYGITWTFDKAYPVGQFVTGDWWVLGPVTIVSITPASTNSTAIAKNGSMINPVRIPREQGYDEDFSFRITYNASKNVALNVSGTNPLVVGNDSSLVSSISNSARDPWSSNTQIKQFAILTVLPSAPPANSFRPHFCGPGPKTVLFNESDLDYSVLGTLAPTASAPSFSSVLDYDQNGNNRSGVKRPWVDYMGEWSASRMFPVSYGQYLSTNNSDAALLLNCNYTNAQKRELLIHFVQGGIDLYGAVLNSSGGFWIADGGNGSGRPAAILLAGKVLGNSAMQNIVSSKSDIWFQEMCNTFYVPSSYVGTRGYTSAHVGLPEWGLRHCYSPSLDDASPSTSYRQCCTGRWWFGEMMAVLIMGLRTEFDHPAYFDYLDRYRLAYLLSGVPQPSAFPREMYDAYRSNYPPVWTAPS